VICEKCGAEIAERAKFCSECGAAVLGQSPDDRAKTWQGTLKNRGFLPCSLIQLPGKRFFNSSGCRLPQFRIIGATRLMLPAPMVSTTSSAVTVALSRAATSSSVAQNSAPSMRSASDAAEMCSVFCSRAA